MNATTTPVARLKSDLERMVDDVEDVAKAARNSAAEHFEDWRRRADATLDAISTRLAEIDRETRRDAARARDRVASVVESHPWWSVTAAAMSGLFVSMLLRRRF